MVKETNPYYKAGDNCYVLDSGKIKFCEVLNVLSGLKECEVAYELRDLVDYRYFVAAHELCHDTEASAKNFKRDKFKKPEVLKRKSRKK